MQSVYYSLTPWKNHPRHGIFNLPIVSINSWTKLQKGFLDKFATETTTGTLMDTIVSTTMGPKEKVKYFN